MNKTNLITTIILAGSIVTQAQLIDDAYLPLEKKPAAHKFEKSERMAPGIQKFVKEQKSKKELRKVVLKSDIIGRKGKSKSASVSDSTTFMVNDTKNQKKKIVVSEMMQEDSPIEGYYDDVRYDFNTGKAIYTLNGKEVSKDQYRKKIKDIRKKNKGKNSFKKSKQMELTADEIENLYNSNSNIIIAEPAEEANDASTTYGGTRWYEPSDIQKINGLKDNAYNYGYKGQDIGIYIRDIGCGKSSYLGSYYKKVDCMQSNRAHPTGVAKIVHSTAPEATLYAGDYWVGYDDLSSNIFKDAEIMIGTNSYHMIYSDKNAHKKYQSYDKDMDDYIYANDIVEFIAAGNTSTEEPYLEHYVGTPGKSVNSITVGAVKPSKSTYNGNYGYTYEPYSGYKNSNIDNTKPEITNFTNFWFKNETPFVDPYDSKSKWTGYMNGTSSSTPYSAGMAALLMSQRPEFQFAPEKVKATFIAAGSIIPVDGYDYDQGELDQYVAHIPMYEKMLERRNHVIGWHKKTQKYIFGSSDRRKITETNIVKGKRYRVAIAWMSKGSYVFENGKLPQDFDIFVTINGKWYAQSNSPDNPFEVIEFTAPESGYVDVNILNYRNDAPNDPISLGYSFVRINQSL